MLFMSIFKKIDNPYQNVFGLELLDGVSGELENAYEKTQTF